MALSTLKLAMAMAMARQPPAAGDENRVRRSVLIATSNGAVPPQVKSENDQKALSTSRRDLIWSLTAASVAGVTLFSTEHVEARTMKSENRKNIMEKLKKLREKAAGSNSKIGQTEKEPLSQPLVTSATTFTSATTTTFIYPHKKPNGALVEAVFPL